MTHRSARLAGTSLLVSMMIASMAIAAPTDARRARVAIRYLVSHQATDGSLPSFSAIGSTADAVLAMVAARRAPDQIDSALDYLKAHIEEADSIGLKAKVAAAAAVGGSNARRFAGHNLIAEIKASQQPDGRFGADTPVLHHALAILAIASVGQEPFGPATDWLLSAQCPDGGWQFDEPPQEGEDEHCLGGEGDFFQSETDTTAIAIQALYGAAVWEPGDPQDPFAFLEARRDPVKGGWGYDPTYPLTNTNSTALVIEAYDQHEYRTLPAGAKKALRALQYRLCGAKGGAFAYTYEDPEGDGTYKRTPPDVGATIEGVIALRGRPFDAANVELPAPKRRPCA